ncbi:MAG: 3-hydroxyacyl-CoA dehydrogenase family protein [Opitutaceae bacterium]|nr:3-hydroxyacyl-CoA dehydrogenase family protein [Opitutaceae bacterium]
MSVAKRAGPSSKRTGGPARGDRVGVIGLGLMGRGIVSSLLSHGLDVVAYTRSAATRKESIAHVGRTLRELAQRRIVPRTRVRDWKTRFQLVESIGELSACGFVIETVKEDLALKRSIYGELERCLRTDAVIASNTSSIPISVLQAGLKRPARLVGMHWGEPAQIMRYLEIIPGRRTSPATLRRTLELGVRCGKEPTVLREDVRGFLSNRMMYAMIREAFHLVESGVADIETVDRSFRNDIGWWALLAGPFRWMDLTGIPAYALVMEELLPKLSTSKKVPALMRAKVAAGARGTANAKGFYRYSPESARRWEKKWIDFTYDMRRLADKYAADHGE